LATTPLGLVPLVLAIAPTGEPLKGDGPDILLGTLDVPLGPVCVANGLTRSGTTSFDVGLLSTNGELTFELTSFLVLSVTPALTKGDSVVVLVFDVLSLASGGMSNGLMLSNCCD
jgi:hypothetical protein